MPAAFREARVLGDDRVVGDAQPPFEERVVGVEPGEPVVRLEEPPHMPARRAKRRARQRLRLEPAVPAVGALAQHEARVAELLDPELAVVREPAVERLGVRLGPVEQVAIPHGRGLDRIVGRGVEEERVAAGALAASCAGAPRGRPVRAPTRSGRTRTRRARGTAGAVRTTCSETASPRMPPSRKRKVLSGETTYGGFATTRSNCSPSTGSKKLPCRVSTLSTPLSAALNAAYRARSR